jgi:RNA polymerase sigma-70 factor (ECF subfamily)
MAPTIVDDAMAMSADDELAARAAHDLEAFAELYRRHLCHVYRFVRAQTPDDDIAEDLTAQVFFKALSSAGSYRAEGSYRAWLFRIAHNTVRNWRARERRLVAVERLPEEADPAPSPASQAIAADARGALWRSVAELPDLQREVVALRYGHDLSIEEIARLTRRSRGAVRILLHRARQRLRRALETKHAAADVAAGEGEA